MSPTSHAAHDAVHHTAPGAVHDATPRPGHGGPGHAPAPLRIATTHFRLDHPGVWEAHHHGCHELLWGTEGTLTVETDDGLFVVPATLGLWIPAGVTHAVRSASRTGFSCTYLSAPGGGLRPGLDERIRVVDVPPVIRELLLLLRTPELTPRSRACAEELLLGLIAPVDARDISLPMPDDARLTAICQRLLAEPADSRSLREWGREVGGSARNLSRLFAREAGMTFEQWRIQARMRVAVGLLTSGTPVNAVARAVGYTTPSSFVQSFRRVMGHTPGRYAQPRTAPNVADTRHDWSGDSASHARNPCPVSLA